LNTRLVSRLTLLTCLVFFGGCSDAPVEETESPTAALSVELTSPQIKTLSSAIETSGNVQPWQEASIGAQTAGLRISQVLVNTGDWVQQGQVLATFDPAQVTSQTAELEANIAEARTQLAQAILDAQRFKSLEGSGAVSDYQVSQAITAVDAARARVNALNAGLDSQSFAVANTQVLAPDSGLISQRTATVGAVAGTGTPLFQLIRAGRLEWQAEVSPEQLARIRVGTPVKVTSPSGKVFSSTVTRLGPSINPTSRVGYVYAPIAFGKPEGNFSAGMYVDGVIELGRYQATVLPQSAVIIKDGFELVYEISPDNRAIERRVEVGASQNGLVEIKTALPKGTQVVLRGGSFLNDGDLVSVINKPLPTPKKPAANPAQPSTKDSAQGGTLANSGV